MRQGDGEAGSYRTSAPAFPILVVGDANAWVHTDEADYRPLVEVVTAEDHRSGFRAHRVFDLRRREFRFTEVRFSARSGFRDWLSPRRVDAMKFEHVKEDVALDEIREAVLRALWRGEWTFAHAYRDFDLDALCGDVEGATSVARLCTLFGTVYGKLIR